MFDSLGIFGSPAGYTGSILNGSNLASNETPFGSSYNPTQSTVLGGAGSGSDWMSKLTLDGVGGLLGLITQGQGQGQEEPRTQANFLPPVSAGPGMKPLAPSRAQQYLHRLSGNNPFVRTL